MQATELATAARTGLRPLNPTEDGTAFRDLPNGVFGFTYAPLSETPLFARNSYHSFEVHKLADGSGRIVCWTTPEHAAALQTINSMITIDIYPAEWGPATRQVVIPMEQARRKDRNPLHEDGGRLVLHVFPD